MTPLDLMAHCSPQIAPVTLAAIVQHESGGNPLALHDNTAGASYWPQTEAEAIALAKSLMALGHSVDLGMGQINSRNLSWLGQSAETIFKPCANLAAMQGVLLAAWRQSGGSLPNTLSIYSTGKINSLGLNYTAAIYAQADSALGAPRSAPVVPAIADGKLPAWASRELPDAPNASLISPEVLRAAASPAATARGAAHRTAPADSALRPDAGDLHPGQPL
ncbi:MAG: lytic transglycosylase domain-containing protein [Burkholderiaceae bacterium]|jgi:type IV secretion system protein VirB1|nr:lytic transglycosylase domain-containing protein [Burkholderiaceae bacterium]